MTDESDYFEQDENTGQIKQKYSDNIFIEAVRDCAPASTREVGEAVGCSLENAYRRLNQLEDAGEVESKMAGNSLIWFPVK